MFSVKETAKQITCPTESDEMESKAYCEILERRPKCKEPDRNHYTFEIREIVQTAIEQGTQQQCKSTSGVVQW